MNNDRVNQNEEPPEPERLRTALAALHKERVFVPPQVDQVVLARARTHLEQAAWRRPRRLIALRWLAAAAALVFAAWLARDVLKPAGSSRPAAPALAQREDLNGDGRVDILDAFILARQIQQGSQTKTDLNGDGKIDQRDVDLIAQRAVKLERKS